MHEIWSAFLKGLLETSFWEAIAVIAGIASVWYSRSENILVYPVGLINTIIYIFLSLQVHLYGEASVNLYYTVMSIYGWILWGKRDDQKHHITTIQFSNRKELIQQIAFFLFFYISIYFVLSYLKKSFSPGAIPFADALASASAFTGMWLMARKKVESWYWWIITNICSIPLYFIKGFVFTSVYYLILLILAFAGLMEWYKKARLNVAQ
ncbi:MAG: nicotinamide riboside transporter PnuC [Chitinophagaceae bacterium]